MHFTKIILSNFTNRHVGISKNNFEYMLGVVKAKNMNQLISEVINSKKTNYLKKMDLPKPLSENKALKNIEGILNKNVEHKSLIGIGGKRKRNKKRKSRKGKKKRKSIRKNKN